MVYVKRIGDRTKNNVIRRRAAVRSNVYLCNRGYQPSIPGKSRVHPQKKKKRKRRKIKEKSMTENLRREEDKIRTRRIRALYTSTRKTPHR